MSNTAWLICTFLAFCLGISPLTKSDKNDLFPWELKNKQKLSLHIKENRLQVNQMVDLSLWYKGNYLTTFCSIYNYYYYFVTKLNYAFCCDRSQSIEKNKLSFTISITSLPDSGSNMNVKWTYYRIHDWIIVMKILMPRCLVFSSSSRFIMIQ